MIERYWEESFFESPDMLWAKRPASLGTEGWKTALPLGNGITGALLFGAVGKELLRFTRYDHWAGAECSGELPDVSAALAEMRRGMEQKKWSTVQNCMQDALCRSGYQQSIAEPFPVGQLRLLATDIDAPFRQYRRGLQMDLAQANVRWKMGERRSLRRCFVSQADGLVWLCQQDDVPRKWELNLESCIDDADTRQQSTVCQIRRSGRLLQQGTMLVYIAAVEGRVIGIGVQVLTGQDCKVTAQKGYLEITGTEFTVKACSFTVKDEERALEYCTAALGENTDDAVQAYERALQVHAALWRPMYSAVRLSLTDSSQRTSAENAALLGDAYEEVASAELYEKLWRFSRYLFLSGTAEQGNPFPLYGLWAGDYGLPWTQHVANENVQMIYSPALAGGCFAAYRALIKYYTGYIELFRQNAKQLFGCRGIFVPAYTAPVSLAGIPTAGPAVSVPVILHWISGAGWLAAGFCEYYRYTGDEALLRSDILPFLLETARFYLDYVQWDENGNCHIYPSVSPENTPGNLMPEHFTEDMGHVCPAVENATMDFAVMKEVLVRVNAFLSCPEFVEMASRQEKEQWQKLLAGIPPYQIDPDTGAVCEWMQPELQDYNFHRHVSHLYPMFPGKEIRMDNAPDLMKAFEASVRRRILGSKSGWAFAHLAAIWARLGQGEAALGELDLLCKACLLENFFTLHNDWRHMGASLDLGEMAPVQLDALLGAANALQEMLVYTAEDSLQLLGALPARFVTGSVEGMYIPQGRLDIKWSADRGSAVLYPRCDAHIAVYLPDGSCQKLQLQCNKSVQIEFSITGRA